MVTDREEPTEFEQREFREEAIRNDFVAGPEDVFSMFISSL